MTSVTDHKENSPITRRKLLKGMVSVAGVVATGMVSGGFNVFAAENQPDPA